ncbi:MAG: methyltransferase domain-containing protein [Myxococcales bacterium]|nr:methyltransferase domain-containing protein [Myxococcales bacterium]MCB9713643.1 methyltransferase domain-containing protein [Myxococcales bacterium]MCB9713657.1 methyltransferase domain-containing protein [Myxococcales bacterium]
MAQRGITEGLDQHEVSLSAHQLTDFRSLNLFRMVAQRVIPGTVMDVGAGGGGMVAWLLEKGFDARGIDLSPRAAAAAQDFLQSRGLPRDRIRTMGLQQLIEQGETHDNVLSMDCIEHIEDDRTAFAQLVGLTRPGGRIVITVPALMALYGARDEAQGHYRRYEKESLRALTEGHPVRVDELRYWNALGVGPTFVNQRLLGRAIDESFRYGKPGLVPRMLRRGLSLWFSQVENRISPPLGLTLLMVATRL